jgi:hypothetical protein
MERNMSNMRNLNSLLKNLFNYAKIAHFPHYSNSSHSLASYPCRNQRVSGSYLSILLSVKLDGADVAEHGLRQIAETTAAWEE